MLLADNTLTGSHTDPEFDKLIPLSEVGVVLGFGTPASKTAL
jgi:hypothetical protein